MPEKNEKWKNKQDESGNIQEIQGPCWSYWSTYSIFNYDLISICETSLNDSVGLPETLLDDYTFVPANKPGNIRHGVVGLFYKNSLPVIVRNDLLDTQVTQMYAQ